MNVLVIALDAASPPDLDDADVSVVAPALNSRLRHWLSDEDASRRRAEQRADACVAQLERSGVHANGRIGDADPLQPGGVDDLAARARKRFALPVLQARRPRPGSHAEPRPPP